MIVLGFTGTFAAGKDTAISIIASKFGTGIFQVSTSDLVREETTRRGLSLQRENLRVVSNDMRQKHGSGVFGKMTVQRIKQRPEKQVFLVSGIRTVGEVSELRKEFGKDFHLIAIDAPIEVRYQRVKQRARAGEHVLSFEEFKQSEEKEMKGAVHEQNITNTMELADYTIDNDLDILRLEFKITDLLMRLGVVSP